MLKRNKVGGKKSGKKKKKKRKGHGKNGAAAYHGAKKIKVSHESLKPKDRCPDCHKGKLYELPEPGTIVRVTGNAPCSATVYGLQKLRCNLCQKIFTAQAPDNIGDEKYDAATGAMIALLKYGSGLPFNRFSDKPVKMPSAMGSFSGTRPLNEGMAIRFGKIGVHFAGHG